MYLRSSSKKLCFKTLKHILVFFLLSRSISLFSQDVKVEKPVNYQTIFNEIKSATKNHKKLWNKDLYAPILLVNPITRQVIANDTSSELKLQDGIYVGKLPENINIANTTIKWKEKRWAMIILPLPEDKYDRINLVAHELFHTAQADLEFEQKDPINTHLDNIRGRIYLTLELEALKNAITASDDKVQLKHILNALALRKYRQNLFPGSDSTENKLELNEGMTEYTGFMIADRPHLLAINHFILDINYFLDNSTFVRSFPFHTIPIYGFLLNKTDTSWNRKINSQTNLTDFFINEFNNQNANIAIETIAKNYGYFHILEKEKKREEEINRKITNYKKQFLNLPTLKLTFEKMNVAFNPSNILPLENLGNSLSYYKGN